MKKLINEVLQKDIFVILMVGVIAETAMIAVIISVLQVPSDDILDSGLDEVLLVFNE